MTKQPWRRQPKTICRVSNVGMQRLRRPPNDSGIGEVIGFSKCRMMMRVRWDGRQIKSIPLAYVELLINQEWVSPADLSKAPIKLPYNHSF